MDLFNIHPNNSRCSYIRLLPISIHLSMNTGVRCTRPVECRRKAPARSLCVGAGIDACRSTYKDFEIKTIEIFNGIIIS